MILTAKFDSVFMKLCVWNEKSNLLSWAMQRPVFTDSYAYMQFTISISVLGIGGYSARYVQVDGKGCSPFMALWLLGIFPPIRSHYLQLIISLVLLHYHIGEPWSPVHLPKLPPSLDGRWQVNSITNGLLLSEYLLKNINWIIMMRYRGALQN